MGAIRSHPDHWDLSVRNPAMKIAITGGSGTIAQAVIALGVEQGHRFVNLDIRAPAPESPAASQPLVQVSTADYDALHAAARGCDALIHLAAIGHRPYPDHRVLADNVCGAYNALHVAASLGIRRVCQASSVNAIGHTFSREPRYDYFPLDEAHPTYAEDPYSLSKWLMEQQADGIARRHPEMSIASLRFHGCWADVTAAKRSRRSASTESKRSVLACYTSLHAAARACMLALTADFSGHEVMFVVAPQTLSDRPSRDLAREWFPDVPIRGDFDGHTSFFDSRKAERILGWRHEVDECP